MYIGPWFAFPERPRVTHLLGMFNLWGYIPLQGDNNNKINLYKVPKGTTIAFEDMYQQISEELAKAQNQGSSIVGSLINWDTKKVPDGTS